MGGPLQYVAKKYIYCAVLPNNATEICIVGSDYNKIKFNISDTIETHHILHKKLICEGEHTIWTVIPNFQIIACGNLACYATILGTEDFSTCKGSYCTLNQSGWKRTPLPQSHKIIINFLTGTLQQRQNSFTIKLSRNG